MQRLGGMRRKTRFKLQKSLREKGKISIRKFIQTLKDGTRVALKAEPAYQKGMYHPRFHGKCGVVNGKQGKCYSVDIKDGGKTKSLLVHPIHLKTVNE